jgi:hypothetical protein
MNQDAPSLQDRPKYARIVYDYPINDPNIVAASGVTQISMMTLTADDELMAAERCGGNQLGLAYELAKQSWCQVTQADGTVVSLSPGDGTVDQYWNDPKFRHIRSLATSAYQAIHQVKKDVTEDFLKGCTVRVR